MNLMAPSSENNPAIVPDEASTGEMISGLSLSGQPHAGNPQPYRLFRPEVGAGQPAALSRPNGGDQLARCRIDHGAVVDHHGRDRLVTAGHGANEGGRIGVPPDVDLPDGNMMPPQGKTQPPAEHTARPPVQGDPGSGTGLLAG